jgi:hypothetical protein
MFLKIKRKFDAAVIDLEDYLANRRFSNAAKSAMKLHNIPNVKAEGEDEWLAKWRKLTKHKDVYSYRLYSHFCGPNPNIVPWGIYRGMVERTMDPEMYSTYYDDKNMYDQYMGDIRMPKAYLRCVGGDMLDGRVPFGKFTDEIIDYCAANQHRKNRSFML